MRRTVNLLWIRVLIVFAAHNCEETIAIANGWTTLHFPQSPWAAARWPMFAAIATALTLSVGLVAWVFRFRPERSRALLRVFLWIMLINAAWHIGVSVYTRSLAPGAATAVLLVLPLYSSALRTLSRASRTT